jgi:hypothetical protein
VNESRAGEPMDETIAKKIKGALDLLGIALSGLGRWLPHRRNNATKFGSKLG